MLMTAYATAAAAAYTPGSDAQVLAIVPPGSAHASLATRQVALRRPDVALPLAQFYIGRARVTGDLRYLGYAEGMLTPWLGHPSPVRPAALVLHATILQSRHAFDASLVELSQALALQPVNAQAWLTRATVLRVQGRYALAMQSCEHLGPTVEPVITQLCVQSLQALTGHLGEAYAELASAPHTGVPREVRAWRDSELGEMAERMGNDSAAEQWLRDGLTLKPEDFYMRTAYADLLLRHHRAADTLRLLSGYDAIEPMLLRIVLARQMLGRGEDTRGEALLANAFAVEEQRGEAIHRREQARFLLDVERRPAAALTAAEQDIAVQREPDDLMILLRAAQAARQPDAAAPARDFIVRQHLQDVRLQPYLATRHP